MRSTPAVCWISAPQRGANRVVVGLAPFRYPRKVRAEAPSSSSSSAGSQEVVDNSIQGLNSIVEKLRERIRALETQLVTAVTARSQAESLRLSLEAEAQEVAQLAVQAQEARNDVEASLEAVQEELQRAEVEAGECGWCISWEMCPTPMPAQPMLHHSAEGLEKLLVTLGEPGAGSPLPAEGSDPASIEGADGHVSADQVAKSLAAAHSRVSELSARAAALSERFQAMEVAMSNAEEMAHGAMQAAEAAVADEMTKAAAVQVLEDEVTRARGDLEKMLSAMLKATERFDGSAKPGDGASQSPASSASSTGAATTTTAASGTAEDAKEDLVAVGKEGEAEGAKTKPPRSSKYQAASFFSSGDTPDPDDAIPALAKWMQENRLLVLGGAVVLTAATWAYFNSATFASIASSVTSMLLVPFKLFMMAQAKLTAYLTSLNLPHIEAGMLDVLWLLLTSIITVPLVCKIPGGSPVLGFLLGGALIGPHAMGLIQNLQVVHHTAELGVVFLMFNIGLELSLDRLQAMGKFVFGLGSAQVVLTLAAIAGAVTAFFSLGGPTAVIIGASLALSSTAVALQVLQDRGESSSRHGRATFSVLLFQDLAVVVILMLIPLLAPGSGGAGSEGGMAALGQALLVAAVKAVICITGIMVGGRIAVKPLFKKIAALGNPELFAATTLLVCLGTSVLTQVAGLSMALGAFLAGLVIAETEFALQVESDIAPYRGLLLGLFFMTVGMEISPALLANHLSPILAGIAALLVGKVLLMVAIGPVFGLSRLASLRAGLYLAPGGEFAFVALGDAVAKGIVAATLSSKLFLVVALSMALTPYLAAIGASLGDKFEKVDVQNLQPSETESDDLRDHVIICGFGRSGQLVAQLLSERLIPFVCLDVRADRVQAGRQQDLRVYFGDAGNREVLHKVGADRAACAVITLDSPGANYRAVWAFAKNYPNVKIFARAHDINHGVNLEKAGATAVVPETLEPSLQLAVSVAPLGSRGHAPPFLSSLPPDPGRGAGPAQDASRGHCNYYRRVPADASERTDGAPGGV